MEWEEIDRPAKYVRTPVPKADVMLLEALIRTSVTGRALRVRFDAVTGQGNSGRGPIAGDLYRLGYALHCRRMSGSDYAAWTERDVLCCTDCSTVVDLVRRLALGGSRLRRRDDCDSEGCNGRMIAPRERVQK